MSYNIVKLDYDPTGINVNNRIIDEPHNLSNAANRSIAPELGPFFAESVIVKDGVNILSRGTDYQIVELHQELSLLLGKEISSVILIINPSISSNVTITLQYIGGHYCYSGEVIANVYESVVNDNRPIAWENVFNKPIEYPPTIHRHLLDDVFGFEPVVDALERIKRAVTLGQTQVVIQIVTELLLSFRCDEADQALPVNRLMSYDHFLFFLSQKKLLSDLSLESKLCTYKKGSVIIINIDTSRFNYPTNLYWELYRYKSTVNGFMETSGIVNTNDGDKIFIYVPTDDSIIDTLYVGLRLTPDKPDFDAVTYRIKIEDEIQTTLNLYSIYSNRHAETFYTTTDFSLDEERSLFYGYTYKL